MQPNPKNNIFNTPSTQSKPSTNIYAQKNPSPNIFGGSSSQGTNIWSQRNQQPSQKLSPSTAQPKQAPGNPFADIQKSIPRPNFE